MKNLKKLGNFYNYIVMTILQIRNFFPIFNFLFEEINLKDKYIADKLDECRVLNTDNSNDYLKLDDFDTFTAN